MKATRVDIGRTWMVNHAPEKPGTVNIDWPHFIVFELPNGRIICSAHGSGCPDTVAVAEAIRSKGDQA